MTAQGPDVLDGERGLPTPGTRGPSGAVRGAVGLVLLVAAAGASTWAYWQMQTDDAAENDQARGTHDLKSSVPAKSFKLPPEPAPEPEPAPDNVIASVSPVYVPAPAPIPVASMPPRPPLPAAAAASPTPALDRGAGSMMIASSARTSEPTSAAGLAGPSAGPTGDTGFGFGDSSPTVPQGSLESRLTATPLEATLASQLTDRNLLIARGTMIDCVLRTRIVTSVPGGVACAVTRNVYSDNGKILLLERGSLVTGEYRSNVQQGTARVFVLWSRVKTPEGVVVDLDSPATDALGASGIPGEVDTHFWTRFGGAILLSLVDDVASAAVASSRDAETQVNVGSGAAGAGSRVIDEVLSQTVNIPPTISVDQGARVGIYVARDLDFRSVYDVVAR